MKLPTAIVHLWQFFCALPWVKTAIPNLNAIVEPLHSFLEKVYEHTNVHTKHSASKI